MQLTDLAFSCEIARDMTHTTLHAESRTITGRKNYTLRNEDMVPAVVYGFGIEPTKITLDRVAFDKAYATAGASTVVDLDLGGTVHPVLISEVQRNPLNDFAIHADFRRVDLSKKIEAKIPLKLVGISSAVKDAGGTLVQSLEDIEVLCLPNALVHDISVDIRNLKTFDDVIRVSDITIPAGIEVKTSMDAAVASVQPPRSEAEIAALDAAVEGDVSKVEVTSEKKLDEAAPAEGGAKKAE